MTAELKSFVSGAALAALVYCGGCAALKDDGRLTVYGRGLELSAPWHSGGDGEVEELKAELEELERENAE
jgi:hypothetical protein